MEIWAGGELYQVFMLAGEIVVDTDRFDAHLDQFFYQMAADKSGAAGDNGFFIREIH